MKMNQLRESFPGKVLISFILTVGGMALGGVLCPSVKVYPFFLVIGLIPAMLFMGWALGESWKRFWPILGSMLLLAGIVAGVIYYFKDSPYLPYLMFVIPVASGLAGIAWRLMRKMFTPKKVA